MYLRTLSKFSSEKGLILGSSPGRKTRTLLNDVCGWHQNLWFQDSTRVGCSPSLKRNEPIPEQDVVIPISGQGQFLSTLVLQYEPPFHTVFIPVTWFRVDEDEHLLGKSKGRKRGPAFSLIFLMFLFSISLCVIDLVHVRARSVLIPVPPTVFFF